MNERYLKYFFGIASLLLLISFVVKIIKLPGGLILPGWLLGSMLLIGILVMCLIIAGLTRLAYKQYSFTTSFFILSTIAFIVVHYYLYSPTLKITVPNGYTGEVALVLSNVDNNILTIDSNGIGYINKWTFDKVYTEPVVVNSDGQNINNQCVGFNPSSFWGKGNTTLSGYEGGIKYLLFEIVPIEKKGQKQYYSKDFNQFIDHTKLPISE